MAGDTKRVLAGFALVFAVAGTVAAYSLVQSRSQERLISAAKGRSIPAQLSGKEASVTVTSTRSRPLVVSPPSDQDAVAWNTFLSEVVALVVIKERQPRFTQEKDWVQTDVTAEVMDVLKQTSGPHLQAGRQIKFVEEGGELPYEQTKIRAIVPWAEPLVAGREYILFAMWDKEQGWIIGPSSTYADTPEGFVSLLEGGPETMKSLGVSRANVISRIKAAAAIRR